MSATRDPMAGIDFSKPVSIDPDDITGPEFDAFLDVTGGELWPFLTAVRNGEIAEDQLLVGKNRKAMYALTWIFFRRQIPALKFEQVYARGIGEIGIALGNIQRAIPVESVENGQRAPSVASGWQQGQ